MTEAIEILTGKKCQYCKNNTEYIDSIEIYGKSHGMLYICRPCKAYVGVHKGTDKALGIVANSTLREMKSMAHSYFDQIAKSERINDIWPEVIPNISNRKKAYKWLSLQLNIPEEFCHIGMMDIEGCARIIEISKKALKIKLPGE